jgi:hypothetical protein
MCLIRSYGTGSEWIHEEDQSNTRGFAGCLFNVEYLVIIMFVTVTKKVAMNVRMTDPQQGVGLGGCCLLFILCNNTVFFFYVHVTVHGNKFLFNKNQPDALFPNFIFGLALCMFRAVALPIIRTSTTVHSALVHVIQVFEDSLQAESGWNCSAKPTIKFGK